MGTVSTLGQFAWCPTTLVYRVLFMSRSRTVHIIWMNKNPAELILCLNMIWVCPCSVSLAPSVMMLGWQNLWEVVSALRRGDTVLQNRFLLLRISSSKAQWPTMSPLLPRFSPCMFFFKLLCHCDGIHYENFTEAKQMQVPCLYVKLKLHNPPFFFFFFFLQTIQLQVLLRWEPKSCF